MMETAREIVEALGLAPHPEGGWYRETWRAPAEPGGRAAGTAIYYLLEAHQFSHWHRVDAAEIWLWHLGAPLALTLSSDGHDAETRMLGPELAQGQRPQHVVPARWWQTAASLGRFTLVSCTVAPGFEFSGFEMAPADWRPEPRKGGS
ncbi:MAG: cupin domain-containing protein [Pikeienuella sp.]|uniref:cupin domain-containing protein n=1 Tax=Pikeienuella sp. TaxID=2831957 RepID=UPI00391D9A81